MIADNPVSVESQGKVDAFVTYELPAVGTRVVPNLSIRQSRSNPFDHHRLHCFRIICRRLEHAAPVRQSYRGMQPLLVALER